ncbi:hypothetical protein RJ55_08653 [Drechmeria coniospora]|nr:hypothetical protein RJ55_08653 [Drechmeria coniospora]
MRACRGIFSWTVFVGGLPQLLAAAAMGTPTELPMRARSNRLIPVVVGGPQDLFVPNVIRGAKPGDVVQFQFSNGNHTVTESAENAACQPLQAQRAEAIHSGHVPFRDGQTEVGTFTMPVTRSEPMFLYCASGPHCQTGQVMVINPTSDDQLIKYAKLSMGAKENVDGGAVSGGFVGKIPLQDAAFTPAPAEKDGAGPPAEAPATERSAINETSQATTLGRVKRASASHR